MDRWDWIALAPAIYAAGLSTLVFRRQRRQNRDVYWTVEEAKGESSVTHLVITNRGFKKARNVTVELDPPQRSMVATADSPRDVDLGGRLRLGYRELFMEPGASRVVVRWRNLLGRQRTWSTEV